jgi:hypothetical protein
MTGSAGDQTDGSGGGVPTRQPTNLACRQSEPIRGSDGLQIPIDDCLNADPKKGPRSYPFDSPKRTFELSQKRTSELGCYNTTSHNVYYVK